MKTKPIPDDCRTCRSLWTGGVKDGRHDRWCCHWSGPAPEKINHCRLRGGRSPIAPCNPPEHP